MTETTTQTNLLPHQEPRFMHDLNDTLNRMANNQDVPELSDEILDEFASRCRESLSKLGVTEDRDFRLRMSNIGRSTRSLWLQSQYGEGDKDASFVLKMMFGYLIEHLMVALLKTSGADVQSLDDKTEIEIADIVIKGELDINIGGLIYDIKTTTPYGYDHKFNDFEALRESDSFGYCGQGVAYSEGESKPFGGWIVIDKSQGRFKTLSGYQLNDPSIRGEYLQDFKDKVDLIYNGKGEVPVCTGDEPETFYRKPTGRRKLGYECTYCDHKEKCHPDIKYAPQPESKAKNPPYNWYTSAEDIEVVT